jgi:hypothetical protein
MSVDSCTDLRKARCKARNKKYHETHKEVINARKRKYYAAHKEAKAHYRARYRETHSNELKAYHYKRMYGISLTDLDMMQNAQDGCCKICGKRKLLVLDHDHITRKVRGLLCRLCNKGLGHFGDDPNNLASAIQYLRDNETPPGRPTCPSVD